MKLFDGIKNYYVDSVNIEKFSDEIIRESLHKLDPHSTYLTKDEAKAMNESLEGNFDGIGVNFNILNDTILILSVIKGGPSEKAGIKAGDRIIQIEGDNMTGPQLTSKQITSKLRGKSGSAVHIQIKRRNSKRLMPFTIIRGKIPIRSIDASYNVNENTGYIKLSRFSHSTMNELKSVINGFKNEHVNNLIFDLSDNGGGYFEVAINIADEFLDSGKVIVQTKGLHNEKKELSTSKGSFEKGKLVIIIDEGSASASEIVAGAVQDWDRGIIVGRRSFGKGLVQRKISFPDGSEVRLTIERYYTPTGRLIQKPYNDGYKAYSNELTKRIGHGELTNKDSIKFVDSLRYYTLKLKRKVYGGGGIMPDVFVPLDTSRYSNYYRKLLANGTINSFVVQYVDNHRNQLNKKYHDFEVFKRNFLVDNVLLDNLIKYGQDKSISFDSTDFERSKPFLTCYIKALIARNIWDNSEFYEIFNTTDPSFTKAVEVINNWQNYLTSN